MRSTEPLSSIKEAITILFDHANALKKENEVEGTKYKKDMQKRRGYGRENTNMYKNYTETEDRTDKDWCNKSRAVTPEVLQEMWECLIVSLRTETLSWHNAAPAMCTIRHLDCTAEEVREWHVRSRIYAVAYVHKDCCM